MTDPLTGEHVTLPLPVYISKRLPYKQIFLLMALVQHCREHKTTRLKINGPRLCLPHHGPILVYGMDQLSDYLIESEHVLVTMNTPDHRMFGPLVTGFDRTDTYVDVELSPVAIKALHVIRWVVILNTIV